MNGGTIIAPGARAPRTRGRQALDVVKNVVLAMLVALALPAAVAAVVAVVRLLVASLT